MTSMIWRIVVSTSGVCGQKSENRNAKRAGIHPAKSILLQMQIEHSEFQDQLVRGLAHRMNNILTLFHGYLGLLLDNKKLDKPTLDGLAKIQNGARAASDLMDRTHSLVRPSSAVWREL